MDLRELFDGFSKGRKDNHERNGEMATSISNEMMELVLMLKKQGRLPEHFKITTIASSYTAERRIQTDPKVEEREYGIRFGKNNQLHFGVVFTNNRDSLPPDAAWIIEDTDNDSREPIVVNEKDIDSGCMCKACRTRRALDRVRAEIEIEDDAEHTISEDENNVDIDAITNFLENLSRSKKKGGNEDKH